MPDMEAETCVETFLNGWMSKFGVPEVVTTERGSQFESELFQAFTKFLRLTEDPNHKLPSGFKLPAGKSDIDIVVVPPETTEASDEEEGNDIILNHDNDDLPCDTAGYQSLPQEEIYWSLDKDISVPIVRDSMSCLQYGNMKQNLHLSDNGLINNIDKLYKIKKSSLVVLAANGLKDAVKCYCLSAPQRTSVLPLVTLGIRTSLKDDLGVFSAELLYGEVLRLSGECFRTSKSTPAIPAFLQHLKNHNQSLQLVPASNFAKDKVFIHKDLPTTTVGYYYHLRPARYCSLTASATI
ncbi:hypothetical protein AVEN_87478-1 [Araneus ventricosus]|uniref:Integrase catalytic domain-containing protein n=1 Tax=Araneus ventricosus TaxID=182803 RepID=A0A4Y2KXJ3_ARAVE|nr:hypothetical protein AVEN_87478-1 [Araneus ventricosus]